ncbi:MAG: HDIG domain-containing metalloprotein [Pirellulaceae bacterium]
MPLPGKSKKRAKHVAALQLPPGTFQRYVVELTHPRNLRFLGCTALAAILVWLITMAWQPPMPYRLGIVPQRNIHPRVQFRVLDPVATKTAEQEAHRESRSVYDNSPERLEQMRTRLVSELVRLTTTEAYDEATKIGWSEFFPVGGDATEGASEQHREAEYEKLKALLAREGMLNKFEQRVNAALLEYTQRGIMASDQLDRKEGRAASIVVVSPSGTGDQQIVPLNDVLKAQVIERIGRNLELEIIKLADADGETDFLVQPINYWVSKHLPGTLTFNQEETIKLRNEMVAAIEPVMKIYTVDDVISPGGQPINEDRLALLQREYVAYNNSRSYWQVASYSWAILGMYGALSSLCGVYLVLKSPEILTDLKSFLLFLAPTMGMIAIGYWLDDRWEVEMIPVMVLAMTLAIVYRQELSLLVTACVTLALILSAEGNLVGFVTITATCSAAILCMNRIRTRRKLIYVGLWAGLVAFLTKFGVSVVVGQPAGLELLQSSLWQGLWAIVAGFLITGLLPFIEKSYGVLTDISLLELGDAAHPLLQKLAQRAPGTYNHSITVASIAESAAESIGANGLLCRVGAYFHDIGKMMKPEYFIENQDVGGNRHDGLNPAISTLVIIAHVKDGADLARANGLPQPFIDFIEQHHGTTLVEYFYRVASQRVEQNPDEREVDEAIYRYPGPKPQTKEAAVMMICDITESACRTLVEPTSSRIENLVEDLSMKRLLDGQFDECGLTLRELRLIQESITKSLTAVYHGRVKYPPPQPTPV